MPLLFLPGRNKKSGAVGATPDKNPKINRTIFNKFLQNSNTKI